MSSFIKCIHVMYRCTVLLHVQYAQTTLMQYLQNRYTGIVGILNFDPDMKSSLH